MPLAKASATVITLFDKNTMTFFVLTINSCSQFSQICRAKSSWIYSVARLFISKIAHMRLTKIIKRIWVTRIKPDVCNGADTQHIVTVQFWSWFTHIRRAHNRYSANICVISCGSRRKGGISRFSAKNSVKPLSCSVLRNIPWQLRAISQDNYRSRSSQIYSLINVLSLYRVLPDFSADLV